MVVLKVQSTQSLANRRLKACWSSSLCDVKGYPMHNPINCNQLGTYDNPKKPTPTARLPSTSSTKGLGKDKESDLLVADGQHVRLWHLADIGAGIEHVRFRAQSGHSCGATLMSCF